MPFTPSDLDLANASEAADHVYDTIDGFMSDHNSPPWLVVPIATFCSCTLFFFTAVTLTVLQTVVALGSWFGQKSLDAIETARDDNKEAINNLIASTVNEMLGTDFSGDEFTSGSGSGGSINANQALGDSLLNFLEQGFGANTAITPEQGAENARKFAGFGVNFATSQAFFSILAEASTLGLLKEFHELPAGLMQALGLGRLQRLALQPLIRNCIQQPYDLQLKKQLRPDRLTDAQYVKALARGDFDEGYVRERLAEKGFPDDEIDATLHEFAAKLAAGDLAILVRYGDMNQDQAIQQLVDQGIEKQVAEQTLTSQLERLADPRVSAYVSKIQQQRLDGFLTQEQFSMLLDQVPWSDQAKEWERNIVGVISEYPRKRISFAQLKTAVVNGHVDFSYVDEWLSYEGYGDNDQIALTMEIIDAMQAADAKAAAKAKTAAKVAAKGKTPPPTVTS